MIYVVGLGPGHRDYIIKKAIDILNISDKIIGFSRAIDSLDFISSKKEKVDSLKDIIKIINESDEEEIISVIASGDPLFFGIAEYLSKNIDKKLEVIPGISSFQYLTSRVNKSWSFSYTGSLHGRSDSFIEKVLENKLSIWLCDLKNSPRNLCKRLIEANINCKVIIGENLSYDNEIIVSGEPKEFIDSNFSDLSIIVVEVIGG